MIKVLYVIFIGVFLLQFICGCESTAQKQKQMAEQIDKNKNAIENQNELINQNDNAIKGNANNIKTINQNFSTIKTEIVNETKKVIDQKQQNFKESFSAKFEKFEGNYKSEQKNIHKQNSVWVMIAYGILIILGTGLLTFIVIFCVLWFSKKVKFMGRGVI